MPTLRPILDATSSGKSLRVCREFKDAMTGLTDQYNSLNEQLISDIAIDNLWQKAEARYKDAKHAAVAAGDSPPKWGTENKDSLKAILKTFMQELGGEVVLHMIKVVNKNPDNIRRMKELLGLDSAARSIEMYDPFKPIKFSARNQEELLKPNAFLGYIQDFTVSQFLRHHESHILNSDSEQSYHALELALYAQANSNRLVRTAVLPALRDGLQQAVAEMITTRDLVVQLSEEYTRCTQQITQEKALTQTRYKTLKKVHQTLTDKFIRSKDIMQQIESLEAQPASAKNPEQARLDCIQCKKLYADYFAVIESLEDELSEYLAGGEGVHTIQRHAYPQDTLQAFLLSLQMKMFQDQSQIQSAINVLYPNQAVDLNQYFPLSHEGVFADMIKDMHDDCWSVNAKRIDANMVECDERPAVDWTREQGAAEVKFSIPEHAVQTLHHASEKASRLQATLQSLEQHKPHHDCR